MEKKKVKPTIAVCGGRSFYGYRVMKDMATALANGGYPIVVPATGGAPQEFAEAYIVSWKNLQLGDEEAKAPAPITAISMFSTLEGQVSAGCPVVQGVKMEFPIINHRGIGLMINALVAERGDIVIFYPDPGLNALMTVATALVQRQPIVALMNEKSPGMITRMLEYAPDPIEARNLVRWFDSASKGLELITKIEQVGGYGLKLCL